jgi:hypothetical protein
MTKKQAGMTIEFLHKAFESGALQEGLDRIARGITDPDPLPPPKPPTEKGEFRKFDDLPFFDYDVISEFKEEEEFNKSTELDPF